MQRLGRFRIVVQQIDGGHDHARRAVAALQPVFFPEPFLQGVQLVALGKALDSDDLRAISLDGEDGAGLSAPTVDEHRTGATLARIASDVCAGEIELFAQEVHQERSRLHVRLARFSVHCD